MTRARLLTVLSVVVAIMMFTVSCDRFDPLNVRSPTAPVSTCGNDICEVGENPQNCSLDCAEPPAPAAQAIANLRVTTTLGSLAVIGDCTRSTNADRHNINWGDGRDDNSANVTHTYATPGTYDVLCRVWNSDDVEGVPDGETVTVPPTR